MTEQQMDELRAYAEELIEEQMEKIQLKLGQGIEGYQHGDENVLFLEGTHRFPEPAESDAWVVEINGYSVEHSYGQITTGGDTRTWDTTVQSDPRLMVTADSFGGFSAPGFTDRGAFYQVVNTPSSSGSQRFDQTLFLNITDYQFPVRLELRIIVLFPDGSSNESSDFITFTSAQVERYAIICESPEVRVVSAVGLTRL